MMHLMNIEHSAPIYIYNIVSWNEGGGSNAVQSFSKIHPCCQRQAFPCFTWIAPLTQFTLFNPHWSISRCLKVLERQWSQLNLAWVRVDPSLRLNVETAADGGRDGLSKFPGSPTIIIQVTMAMISTADNRTMIDEKCFTRLTGRSG